MSVKYEKFIVLCNGLSRLLGNIVKISGYPFHALFPKKRFTIPEFSPAKLKTSRQDKINRTIWQTNYSNKVTLPMYCDYLFNRLMSLSYDYPTSAPKHAKNTLKPTLNRTFLPLTASLPMAPPKQIFGVSLLFGVKVAFTLISMGIWFSHSHKLLQSKIRKC